MKFRYLFFLYVTAVLFFNTGCFEDQGNYSYAPLNELTIDVPEEIAVLANVDTIKVYPKIVSVLDGEILASNPDYTYKYSAAKELGEGIYDKLFVLDSAFTHDLIIPSKLVPGKYKCWLEVKHLPTEVTKMREFMLNVASATREGWMVLCDEGADNRVRLDMVGVISAERSVQAFDILYNYLPDLHQAYSLSFFRDAYNIDEFIYMLTGSGGYQLEVEAITSGPEYNVNYEFALQNENRIPERMNITSGYRVIVDQNNNAYAMENSSGSIYELPVNKASSGKLFRVAPYIGVDLKIAGNRSTTALLYDMDNQRFMQWNEDAVGVCYPIPDPSDALFSYTTGKELVYMESTRNNNTTYALMKDGSGKYYLYGISMTYSLTATIFKQQYYAEIEATDLDKATAFAFHSGLPYLFYAVGKQLYQYDLYQKKTFPMFSFDSEKISLLKFNLFIKDHPRNPASYRNIPNNLIVATEDEQAKDENKGVLRFYEIPALNEKPTLIGEPYRGFGKIRDVVYRERN